MDVSDLIYCFLTFDKSGDNKLVEWNFDDITSLSLWIVFSLTIIYFIYYIEDLFCILYM